MKYLPLIKERFLQDSLPIQLGGLAANLRRIKSFTLKDANKAVVESLIVESKYFIEWTAAKAEVNVAAELVEIQVQLARWQMNLNKIWLDLTFRTQMAEQAGKWSDRVMDFSGLLTV